MEISYDDFTAYVQPDEAPIIDIPLYSKTASRRTVAKYLKRKSTISKLIAKDQNIPDVKKSESLENLDSPSKMKMENSNSNYQMPYFNENYNSDLAPLIFPSNFLNNNSITDNKENNSSVSEMLKCVLESNKSFIDVPEKNNEFSNHWLSNGMTFDFCQSQISGSGLSASIDKQEREIAYNLLLRRIIDETLDRNVIFSHQPKELLNLINTILVRQFPEYEESKHRSKVRSYLKACRRNSKKNNGKILMKNTAAYLSSGPGNRLMHQIYNNEKETIDIIKKESERFRLAQSAKQSQCQSESQNLSTSSTSSSQQQHILNITNTLPPLLPLSVHSIQPSIRPITQVYTTKTPMNQLPILLPINSSSSSNNSNHTESLKKVCTNPEQTLSDDASKNISKIVKNLISSESSFNVIELVNQLNSTASFLEKFAKTLEKSISNSMK